MLLEFCISTILLEIFKEDLLIFSKRVLKVAITK